MISPFDSFLTFSAHGKTNFALELAGAGTNVWNYKVTLSASAENEKKVNDKIIIFINIFIFSY